LHAEHLIQPFKRGEAHHWLQTRDKKYGVPVEHKLAGTRKSAGMIHAIQPKAREQESPSAQEKGEQAKDDSTR
tara:strand:+ start:295 stop:513 length:219 start_codon:yes stop_codon:yes gene_type:complete